MPMTIDKAIEIKIQWRKDNYPLPLADEMNADMLSIEALKRLQEQRSRTILDEDDLLPGESKVRVGEQQ